MKIGTTPIISVKSGTTAIQKVYSGTNLIWSAFDSDAQAFITAAAITDLTQQNAINQLVVDLKGYGLWSKMKALYPFVGGTASTHKFNLKDPRDLDAAYRLVFSGGWTHSSNGALPNGTNGFANTKLTPSSSLTLNSTHISAYSRTLSGTGYLFGCSNVGLSNRTLWQMGGTSYVSLFTAPGDYFAYGSANTRKLLILNRTASNLSNAWENNTKKATSTNASTNRTTVPIYLSASNDNGSTTNYANVQLAFSSIGDGLTDTEAANLYTSVQAFQTTLGRQI